MKIKIRFTIYLICILFITTSCNNNEPINRTEYALGTIVSVTVYETSENNNVEIAETIMAEAFERLYEIEKIFSVNLQNSELHYVNETALNNAVTVSDELFSVLKTGLEYSVLTNGAFDITLGRLIDLWSIQKVPETSEIERAKAQCGYEYLELDENNKTVRFLNDIKLDLGAIAKGWAADEMKRVLSLNGVTEAVLDLGGDICIIGNKAGSGYRAGISNPRDIKNLIGIVKISDSAAATSGDYERYFTENDVRYHHILDKKTGEPAKSGIISVTVITDNTVLADILSTTCFVQGTSDFLKNLDVNAEAVLITESGQIISTEGIILEENKS